MPVSLGFKVGYKAIGGRNKNADNERDPCHRTCGMNCSLEPAVKFVSRGIATDGREEACRKKRKCPNNGQSHGANESPHHWRCWSPQEMAEAATAGLAVRRAKPEQPLATGDDEAADETADPWRAGCLESAKKEGLRWRYKRHACNLCPANGTFTHRSLAEHAATVPSSLKRRQGRLPPPQKRGCSQPRHDEVRGERAPPSTM